MLVCRRSVLLAALILACAPNAMSAQDWEHIGQREVDFKGDRDTIAVGGSKGSFKQLRIVVRGGSIEMYNMVVTFGNDQKFSPELRHQFNQNSTSRVIDLPGDRRGIRRIDFRYRSINRKQGKATVVVYGR
jgi:hypothetical protein